MNRVSRHLFTSAALFFLLFASACQPGRPGAPGTGTADGAPPLINTAVTPIGAGIAPPTPGSPLPQGQDISYSPLEGGQVLLWAVGAAASSNAGDAAYHASRATGKPDTFLCGDYVTAWQPSEEEREAWLELDYLPHILANGIHIEQSNRPNQVSRVELFTVDGERITIYDSRQEAPVGTGECPASLVLTVPDMDALVRSVRITVERDADEAWTQIDAVGLTGLVAEGLPALEPTPVWANGEEPDDPFQPVHYSNRNRISSILFEGDTLWAAGDGGIVAWDLGGSAEPGYIHAGPMATHALAFCDFAEPLIVAGGDKGVFTLSRPSDSGFSPPFQPLEHPGGTGLAG